MANLRASGAFCGLVIAAAWSPGVARADDDCVAPSTICEIVDRLKRLEFSLSDEERDDIERRKADFGARYEDNVERHRIETTRTRTAAERDLAATSQGTSRTPRTLPCLSNPSALFIGQTNYIYYRDCSNHVHERILYATYSDDEQFDLDSNTDLTSLGRVPTARGDVFAYYGPQESRFVVYRDGEGRIVLHTADRDGTWRHERLADVRAIDRRDRGGPPPATGTPRGYVRPFDGGYAHVIFYPHAGGIDALFRRDAGSWHRMTLSDSDDVVGEISTAFIEGVETVFYRSRDNHLRLTASPDWSDYSDLLVDWQNADLTEHFGL